MAIAISNIAFDAGTPHQPRQSTQQRATAQTEWRSNTAMDVDYAPIASLALVSMVGQEAVVPVGTPRLEQERQYMWNAAHAFGMSAAKGFLLLHLSSHALIRLAATPGAWLELLKEQGIEARQMVLMLSAEAATQPQELINAATTLRRHELRIGLDAVGQSPHGWSLWSLLSPELVRIDAELARAALQSPVARQVLDLIIQLGRRQACELIVPGVNDGDSARQLHELGIDYVQGEWSGKVSPLPAMRMPPNHEAEAESLPLPGSGPQVASLMRPVRPVQVQTSARDVFELLLDHSELRALAVCDGERPVGIIYREQFLNSMYRPFGQARLGRHPVSEMMIANPLLLEAALPIASVGKRLAMQPGNDWQAGFIIVEHGRYRGVGSGSALLQAVHAAEVAAARSCNPVTGLPGTAATQAELQLLLDAGKDFVALHATIASMRPLAQAFGQLAADRVLHSCGDILGALLSQGGFLGHTSHEEFCVVAQAPSWERSCLEVQARFQERMAAFLHKDHRYSGRLILQERDGSTQIYPTPYLAMAAIVVSPGDFNNALSLMAALRAALEKTSTSLPLYVEQQSDDPGMWITVPDF